MTETMTNILNFAQLREMERFGDRVNKLGANFAVCDTEGKLVVLCDGGGFESSREQLEQLGRQVLESGDSGDSSDNIDIPIWRFGDTNVVLAVALKHFRSGHKQPDIIGAALLDLGDAFLSDVRNVPAGSDSVNSVRKDNECFAEMLRLLTEKFQAQTKTEEQIEMVSTELSRTYEELVLLHRISTNMKVTESDANFLQMACDSLTEIVYVEGIAILLEKVLDDKQQLVIAAGSGLIDIDEQMAGILHSRLIEEINAGKEALLDSEVDAAFRYEWPSRTKNIIAVPLFGKEKKESHVTGRMQSGNDIMGLMVAVNRVGKPDFDSTDVKLFNSVASGCAVFIENGRLFNDLKELFIGSLKALTNSIDAKDNYTHGHSSRVAFISRWIADRLTGKYQLEEEQIHQVYLAGLLHDVGKIGVEEAVLRKKGKLTEEEFARIKKHPCIGAGILREIKQMRDIMSGVLCHHERIDGRGYPNGLTGDQIPLIGKIVGLADSFDAMTSKRTYRDAMNIEQAIAEIEKGLGTQFDEEIGRVFLRSDIYHLWSIIQDDYNEIYGNGNSVEYGTAAVGTLVR